MIVKQSLTNIPCLHYMKSKHASKTSSAAISSLPLRAEEYALSQTELGFEVSLGALSLLERERERVSSEALGVPLKIMGI